MRFHCVSLIREKASGVSDLKRKSFLPRHYEHYTQILIQTHSFASYLFCFQRRLLSRGQNINNNKNDGVNLTKYTLLMIQLYL